MSASETNRDDEPPVIEAEIIHDETSSQQKHADTNSHAKAKKPAAPSSAKLGWSVAALFGVFIAGLITAPYAKESLTDLGMLKRDGAINSGGISDKSLDALNSKLALLTSRQTETDQTLGRLSNTLSPEQLQAILGNAQTTGTTTAAVTDRLSTLEDDLARLSRILENSNEGANSQTLSQMIADIARLNDDVERLSTLQQREPADLDGVNSSVALLRSEARQLRSEVTSLRTAMAALEAGSLAASPRGRFLLALARAEDAARSGKAFKDEVSALRPDAASLPALDQQAIGAELKLLEGAADSITTEQSLIRQFPDVAAAVKRAAEKAEGSFLANLFTVRRTDAGATGIDGVLRTAEQHVLAGDLEGALKALTPLEGPAADAMSMWATNARQHRDVMEAFNRLRSIVAKPVASTGTVKTGDGA